MDWETPDHVFYELNEEFHFTLDPCSSDSNHKCEKYFTEAQDGLQQDWSNEIAFVNPPYGRNVKKWVEKCYTEVFHRNCKCAVMLIAARTDTAWFHDYIYNIAEVRFIRGRLRFGGATENAPFPSMVVIFRKPQPDQCLFYNDSHCGYPIEDCENCPNHPGNNDPYWMMTTATFGCDDMEGGDT